MVLLQMLQVRRALTEIMLEVTNGELYDIAANEFARAKRRAAKGSYWSLTSTASTLLLKLCPVLLTRKVEQNVNDVIARMIAPMMSSQSSEKLMNKVTVKAASLLPFMTLYEMFQPTSPHDCHKYKYFCVCNRGYDILSKSTTPHVRCLFYIFTRTPHSHDHYFSLFRHFTNQVNMLTTV